MEKFEWKRNGIQTHLGETTSPDVFLTWVAKSDQNKNIQLSSLNKCPNCQKKKTRRTQNVHLSFFDLIVNFFFSSNIYLLPNLHCHWFMRTTVQG